MRSGNPAATRDATYFDQWYADMSTSPARDAIVACTLGLPLGEPGHACSKCTFSGVALEQARSSSASLLPAGRFEFQVGTLLATGVPPGATDGLMCVDAVQFA